MKKNVKKPNKPKHLRNSWRQAETSELHETLLALQNKSDVNE